MIWLYRMFSGNMAIVYFLYGQVFFLMGFAIALQARNLSKFRLARSLWALAAFGILHGLSEWEVIFISTQADLSNSSVLIVHILDRILMAASYACLFYFGAKLTVETEGRYRWLEAVPGVFFLFWLGNLAISRWTLPQLDDHSWLTASETWGRYLLGLPGSLLTARALNLQRRLLQGFDQARVQRHLQRASTVFYLYAVFGGLIVPRTPFFPSNWLNQEMLFSLSNIPIPIFRALTGVLMAYFMMRTLESFDRENIRHVEEMERKQAVLEDRERIGRDLHDGVIQNIYAAGLILENCCYLINENVDKAQHQLQMAMNRLNSTMRDIRNYILDLSPLSYQETEFHQGLELMLKNLEANSLLLTRLTWNGPPVKLPRQRVSHLYHIVQEILNNVLKHAYASIVEARVAISGGMMELSFKDNGIGFDSRENILSSPGTGQGLMNMQERARLLSGELCVKSIRGQGTEVSVSIPIEA